jgi:serine/threonine protein kinase
MAAGASLYPHLGDVLNEKYVVTRRIGAGSFGAVYEVQNLEDGELYAVKLENNTILNPKLAPEYQIYQILGHPPAFPQVYEFWIEPSWKAMIMQRLGRALGVHYRRCRKIFSLKTVCMCAIQMISRAEYLHNRCFIHRDIKPDNFVFGVGTNSNVLYMIDLGLAKLYRDLKSFEHIPWSEECGLTGTARYVSINVHLGVDQSCRDDLESIGFLLVSFAAGKLPWDTEHVKGPDKSAYIADCKMKTSLAALCEGLPREFLSYMQKVRQLRFDEKPNYPHLRGLFIQLMVRMDFAYDYRFDWVVRQEKRIADLISGATNPAAVQVRVGRDVTDGGRGTETDEDFKQPLPGFAAVQAGARMVARSRYGKTFPEIDRGHKSHREPKPEPELKVLRGVFLLNSKTAPVPRFPVDLEFEPLPS